MSEFQDEIMRQLRAIEAEENVRILYACESGSRAWGFPPRTVTMMCVFCISAGLKRICRFLNQGMS